MYQRYFSVAVLVAVLAACHLEEKADHGRSHRAPATGIQVSSQIILAAGIDSSHRMEFSELRGPLHLSNGRIVFADASLPRIYVAGPDGKVAYQFGRKGDGPGELRDPTIAGVLAGDTIIVYDLARRTVSLFTAAGTFVRQFRLPALSGSVQYLAMRFGDTLILKQTDFSSQLNGDGLRAADARIVSGVGNSSATTTIATFPGGLFHSHGYRFFGWTGVAAATDSSVWLGAGNRAEIKEVNMGGHIMRTLSWTARPRLVSEENRDSMFAIAKSMNAPPDMFNRDRVADTVPVFGRILPDPNGGLWITAYEAPFAAPDSIWKLDPGSGRIYGVRIPARFRPTEVLATEMLGVWRDTNDVPYPARIRITRD